MGFALLRLLFDHEEAFVQEGLNFVFVFGDDRYKLALMKQELNLNGEAVNNLWEINVGDIGGKGSWIVGEIHLFDLFHLQLYFLSQVVLLFFFCVVVKFAQ